MIEWKDAKEVEPEPKRNLVLLDNYKDIYGGYYCAKRKGFFDILLGEECILYEVTHWDYFEYPR